VGGGYGARCASGHNVGSQLTKYDEVGWHNLIFTLRVEFGSVGRALFGNLFASQRSPL
jgi:hypothetical protein